MYLLCLLYANRTVLLLVPLHVVLEHALLFNREKLPREIEITQHRKCHSLKRIRSCYIIYE